MSHAENTYDFEIAEDDPHYDDMVNYSADMLWVYTYADKESLELDLMEILNQMDLLRGCDDQYFEDGGVLQFYSLQGIKEYFEIVHIQTQELTSIGFKTAILDL